MSVVSKYESNERDKDYSIEHFYIQTSTVNGKEYSVIHYDPNAPKWKHTLINRVCCCFTGTTHYQHVDPDDPQSKEMMKARIISLLKAESDMKFESDKTLKIAKTLFPDISVFKFRTHDVLRKDIAAIGAKHYDSLPGLASILTNDITEETERKTNESTVPIKAASKEELQKKEKMLLLATGKEKDIEAQLKLFCETGDPLRKQELWLKLHEDAEVVAEQYIAGGNPGAAFQLRAKLIKHLEISPQHKLFDFHTTVSTGSGALNSKPQLGTYVDSLGNVDMRGGGVRIDHRNINGKNQYVVSMRVSKNARNKLESLAKELQNRMSATAFQSTIGRVEVTTTSFVYPKQEANGNFTAAQSLAIDKINASSGLEIDFPNLGKVRLNTNSETGGVYQTIDFILPENQDKGKTLKSLLTICTALGLGPILEPQSKEVDERIKIMQLFRTFYPREAFEMENSVNFERIPLDVLRKEMTTLVPEMNAIFKRYLEDQPHLLKKVEIFPGYKVWEVTDLSRQMRVEGGVGLMMGVRDIEGALPILKYGALSSQDRFHSGLMIKGISSEADYSYGSGDQVFSRLITNEYAGSPIKDFDFSRNVQILFKLEAVNRGCYIYPGDDAGKKSRDKYSTRLNALEMLRYKDEMMKHSLSEKDFGKNNEVMIRNRIPIDQIAGVVVQNKEHREELYKRLKADGLIQRDNKGNETYNGIPVENFIHVAEKFSPNMWQ